MPHRDPPRPSPENTEALLHLIAAAINGTSRENASNTPDHILAAMLVGCLDVFEAATNERERWYGVQLGIGNALIDASQPITREQFFAARAAYLAGLRASIFRKRESGPDLGDLLREVNLPDTRAVDRALQEWDATPRRGSV